MSDAHKFSDPEEDYDELKNVSSRNPINFK